MDHSSEAAGRGPLEAGYSDVSHPAGGMDASERTGFGLEEA